MKLAVRGCENYCLGRRIKISTISSSPLSRQSADDEDNSLLSWGLPAAIFWLAAFILCCDGHKKPPLSVGGAHKKKKKTRSAVIFHLDLIRWRAIWRRLFLEWKKKNSSRRAEPSGGVRLPNQGLFFSFFFWRKMQKRFFRQQQQNGRLRSASVRLFIWKSRAPRNRRPRPKEERTRHRQECSSFVS